MNAFFDGYVHSRTTLKEFVDEYDNGLRRMVESETRADFDSFNRTIPCIAYLAVRETVSSCLHKCEVQRST
jgi:hypothetical protein